MRRLLALSLAPALALVPLTAGGAAAAPDASATPPLATSVAAIPAAAAAPVAAPPAAPAAAATPPAAAAPVPAPAAAPAAVDLPGEVARTAAALAEGTRRLEEGQARLARVTARGADVRTAAQRAVAQAAITRARLLQLVGATYRSPRPDQLALALADPDGLGDGLRAAASLDHVQGRQQDLLREADADRERAERLVRRAERLEADAAEQTRVLAAELAALQASAEQARVRLEAAAAQQEADRREREAAAARAARERSPVLPAPAGPLRGVACGGTSVLGSANGMLPASALCPLAGTAGLLLRADAAAAFNRMAAAGGMPCAGSSYRSYGEQVAVYRQKPSLAAVPGTSNHGWGVAVDFACGAESFGTPAYRWLQANAPAYGWTHPAWAEPGGSRPEPWHWEYTG